MEKKYELTNETIKVGGHTLYRIIALKDFSDVKAGDIGGFIESENNLSQYNDAWVCGNARVSDNAQIFGNARVSDNAQVYGEAWVCGNAQVCGKAQIYGNVRVYGKAHVCGYAQIRDNAGYIVFKNWWSSGRCFTWTKSNNMWKVGCFYGTGEELVAKAYQDSELSGREYKRVVDYVESILKDDTI